MELNKKIRLGQFAIDEEAQVLTFQDLRFYKNETTGNWQPSVTTILDAYPKSAYFYKWLKDMGEEADVIRDEAGYSGSIIHNLTERYDKEEVVSLLSSDGSVGFSTKEWKYFEKYVEFSTLYNPEIESIEESFVSDELGIGGTVDRVMIINDERWLIDLKSSNNIQKTHFMQLAAYDDLYNELYPEKPIQRYGILWLGARTRGEAKGKIQGAGWQLVEPPEDIEHYKMLFRYTQQLWVEENSSLKPNNLTYKLEYKKQIKKEAKVAQ